MPQAPVPSTPRAVYAVMAMVGVTVFVLQISLTRLLSASVANHSAFLVISIVMLGVAASGASVFRHRELLGERASLDDAARAAVWGGLHASGSAVVYVAAGTLPWGASYQAVYMALAIVLFFPIFFWTGWVVSYLLAAFHRDAARVYWSDLTGAALGCLVAVPLLDLVSPQVVLLLGGVAATACGWWLTELAAGRERVLVRASFGGLALLAVIGLAVPSLFALRWAKEQPQTDNLWVKWNHLARVNVTPNVPSVTRTLELLERNMSSDEAKERVKRWQMGWGMSDAYTGAAPEILWVELDADAGTQIIHHGVSRVGNDLPFLEWDVTSAAHHLKRGDIERAFVIGGGGGRDILTALHFGAQRVRVAELNPDVVRAVNEEFAEYSGQPYTDPRVDLTIGEARGILTRLDERYDLVQMSMVDTWASAMAGAHVMAENVLYTQEAFEQVYDRLTDDGMFVVTRWHHPENYGQSGRLVALMGAALRAKGVTDVDAHVAVVYARSSYALNVATAILKRTPFTEAELATLRDFAETRGFFMLWPPPITAPDDRIDVAKILAEDADFLAASRFDLSPATDDRPFYFSDRGPFRSWWIAATTGDLGAGNPATAMVFVLVLIALLAGQILVVRPLLDLEAAKPAAQRTRLRDHLGPVLYFAGIGLGFMWVELASIQRYIVFLGHPTYALSVALLALLLFGGIGSALSARVPDGVGVKLPVALVLAGILVTAFVVPSVTSSLYGEDLSVRVGVAVALIAPVALFMGMLYPLGVRLVEGAGVAHLVPWVWAINGISSVLASVTGMIFAMAWGYTVLLLLGLAAYVLTAASTTLGWQTGPVTR